MNYLSDRLIKIYGDMQEHKISVDDINSKSTIAQVKVPKEEEEMERIDAPPRKRTLVEECLDEETRKRREKNPVLAII